MIVTIPEIRKLLKAPLFGNRYYGQFTFTNNGAGKPNIFGNIGYMMNTMNLPTISYSSRQQYIGGINTPVTTLMEQGQLDITVYNTGKEYYSIHKWGEMHYNQATRSYGYMDDVYAELNLYEIDRSTNVILEHRFHKCSLYTYGALQMSYEEAQQVETFQLALYYRNYECILH